MDSYVILYIFTDENTCEKSSWNHFLEEINNRFNEIPDKDRFICEIKSESNSNNSILYETIQNAEYSNKLKFSFFHNGHRFLNILSKFIYFIGTILFFTYIIWTKAGKNSEHYQIVLVSLVITTPIIFLVAYLISRIRKRFFSIITKNIKLGDLIKILLGHDEIITEKRIPNTISLNKAVFPHQKETVYISKKEKYCVEVLKTYHTGRYSTNYEQLLVFIAIDYLANNGASAGYKKSLLKRGLSILSRVNCFINDDYFILYHIGLYSLRLGKYKKAKKAFSRLMELEYVNQFFIGINFKCAKYLLKKRREIN